MAEGAVPRYPVRWRPPIGARTRFDLARAPLADAWSRHPILGEPSHDGFVRDGVGPFVRGEAPFLWPVNGFLFEDPLDRFWYAYVGYYLAGYDLGPGKPTTHCRIHRSRDQGRSWTELGPLFTDPSFRFEGDPHAANVAPDVSVVHDGSRYVLAYDWVHDTADWASVGRPGPGSDSGVGIAVAPRPEGPWTRLPRPVLRNSDHRRRTGPGARYGRAYASSLIRRKRDWLILSDVDSGSSFAWGQIAMTAPTPEGPWSAPERIVDLEGDRWYPAPIEAFPAFVHRGYVYDPRTSVGRNRNHQTLWRAPVERAHRADAWELHQSGSLWHAEPVPEEGFGLWGQTLAGFVDSVGEFRVLFTLRATPGGEGTVRTAHRPWNKPFRDRGFVLSAHGGATATWTRFAAGAFELSVQWRRTGGAARIVWGTEAILGAQGRADGTPHPLVGSGAMALEVDDAGMRIVRGVGPERSVLVESPSKSGAEWVEFVLARDEAGNVTVSREGSATVHASGPPAIECLGVHLDPGTHIDVSRFEFRGSAQPARWVHLWTDAIAGAGVDEARWKETPDAQFRFGRGARCDSDRVKWSFRGCGYRLWLPRGPEWGTVDLVLDGVAVGTVDLHAERPEASRVVHARDGLNDAGHALTVRARTGRMPVDCLDALLDAVPSHP
ncbi:MAG: hypothetical protein ACKO5K_00535 [Armatimonadota bacterium]